MERIQLFALPGYHVNYPTIKVRATSCHYSILLGTISLNSSKYCQQVSPTKQDRKSLVQSAYYGLVSLVSPREDFK